MVYIALTSGAMRRVLETVEAFKALRHIALAWVSSLHLILKLRQQTRSTHILKLSLTGTVILCLRLESLPTGLARYSR